MKIEEFNQERNLARVAAGFKGGDSFNNPRTLPPTSFVGWPEQTDAKFREAGKVTKSMPTDVWNARRSNAAIGK